MTISTNPCIQSFACNGVTQAFPLNFYFLQDSHLVVTKTDVNLAVVTLVLGTDYTVVGSGVLTGGTVTTIAVYASGNIITIQRVVPIEQLDDYIASGKLPAETIERGLDKTTMIEQQLDLRLSNVESQLGTVPVQQPGVFKMNAAILLLQAHISNDSVIPTNYNGLAIQPIIDSGKTVTVAPGSVFVTLDNQGVQGGVALLAANNVFTGINYWGTQNGLHYLNRVDPTYGDFYISRDDNRPQNPISSEHNGFGADITVSSGSASIVPLHGHAIAAGTFGGNAWGLATECYNASNKSGAGLATQLFGAEVLIANLIYNSSSNRHAGLLVVFKNRLDVQDTPVNGVPGGGQSYTRNSSAVYIDSGARIGSSTSPLTGNPAIECGWSKGIYFAPYSLDTASGGTIKAIGIDMTALDNIAPEGGKYLARIQSAIAIPSDLPITFTTDRVTCQQVYRTGPNTIEFRNNGTFRAGFNLTTGILYQWDSTGPQYNYWLDTGGPSTAFMSVRSGSKMQAPANTTTIVNWINILVDGIRFVIPLYQ